MRPLCEAVGNPSYVQQSRELSSPSIMPLVPSALSAIAGFVFDDDSRTGRRSAPQALDSAASCDLTGFDMGVSVIATVPVPIFQHFKCLKLFGSGAVQRFIFGGIHVCSVSENFGILCS